MDGAIWDKRQIPARQAAATTAVVFRAFLCLTVISCTAWLSAPAASWTAAGALVPMDGPGEARIFDLSGQWARTSVALGDLSGDGVADVVVGGMDGVVHAYDVAEGSPLWSYDTGNAAIEGKAAIGDIDGDGRNEVVIGVGSTFTPQAPGGVWAFEHDGTPIWFYPSGDFNGDGVPDGVHAAPALADVDGDGNAEIVYGAWDAHVHALNHDGSPLWEVFIRDTIWSSPAIGDLDHDGRPEIVIGSDAHWEPAYGTEDGGKIYAFNGEDGSILPGFFQQTDEVIWSSPALADIDGDGWLEIIVGTGDCYSHVECAPGGRVHPVTDALYAWDHLGNPLPGWPILLSEFTLSSPAVGDLDNDGDLEVVVNTGDGYVHAFHHDGAAVDGWPTLVTTPAWPEGCLHYETPASPLLVDLTGDGNVELALPSNWEIVVWDRQGNQLTRRQYPVPPGLWSLETEYTVDGTPAAADVDGDGLLELVAPGSRSGGYSGALYVWDFDVASAGSPAPWPQFRRDHLNHARYPLPPVLAVRPADLFLIHEYGAAPPAQGVLHVANQGEQDLSWQIAVWPAEMQFDPYSGVVGGQEYQKVSFTLSTGGYPPGTHPIGTVEVSAGGGPVEGSPATIAVTLYVGPVHRQFLPVLAASWAH
ncbi:MAG: FG-GAP repeat protein [Anaerolineae bacterium]|nr:FG-GAP repeat protein [Anaerolineae bacterium]